MLYMTRRSRITFYFFLLLIGVVFLWQRPLNSPWSPFIAGDGLGYYSYLPAVFIQHDKELRFEWFNETYDRNYVYDAFDVAEDNLLVQYEDRKINKYYPGLSFTWMPFFFCGHLAAKMTGYAADGYTLPYQLAMCAASLFWLLTGLVYLRKLIYKLTANEHAALWVPVFLFFGTNLYAYGIFNNTLSHAYSFTFSTIAIYYMYSYFNAQEKRLYYLLMFVLAMAITVSVRPLNGLIIFLAPAFIPEGFFAERKWFSEFRRVYLIPLAVLLLLLLWHFGITLAQTGKLFAYTYTNERFDFSDSHFIDALFSYHNGLYVYMPLAFIALAGIPFLKGRQRWVVPLFFFAVVFLYSAWWFWPITRRALIDYYPLLALMLAALLVGTQSSRFRFAVIGLILLSIGHYQLKNYQVGKGILSEFSTYSELYWKNYFRTSPANIYPVPPSTIIAQQEFAQDFESGTTDCPLSENNAYSGTHALQFDRERASCVLARYPYPELFDRPGWRKVRVSFETFCEDSVETAGMFLEFRKKDSVIANAPFYLIKEFINAGEWDYKEFGYEITDTVLINRTTVDEVVFGLWRSEPKGKMYLDDFKLEFLLTDRSFETIR